MAQYPFILLLMALGFALSLALTVVDQKDLQIWRAIFKVSAALVFLIIGFQSPFQTSLHYWIMAGLCFGFVGDVALLWQDKKIFLLGIVAFLLGHVFYTFAWLPAWRWEAFFYWPSWIYLLIALGFTPYIWGFVEGKMRVAVCAYILVITLMGLASMGQWLQGGDWRIAVGPLLFAFSDISVALARFTPLPRGHR